MGWLDQLTDMLGGRQSLERFAREQANFDDPQLPDFEPWNHLVGVAPPEDRQAGSHDACGAAGRVPGVLRAYHAGRARYGSHRRDPQRIFRGSWMT